MSKSNKYATWYIIPEGETESLKEKNVPDNIYEIEEKKPTSSKMLNLIKMSWSSALPNSGRKRESDSLCIKKLAAS